MGQTTQDPELFRDRWNDHVDELSSLGWSLEADRISELLELQDELRELIDSAAARFE